MLVHSCDLWPSAFIPGYSRTLSLRTELGTQRHPPPSFPPWMTLCVNVWSRPRRGAGTVVFILTRATTLFPASAALPQTHQDASGTSARIRYWKLARAAGFRELRWPHWRQNGSGVTSSESPSRSTRPLSSFLVFPSFVHLRRVPTQDWKSLGRVPRSLRGHGSFEALLKRLRLWNVLN